MHDVLVVVGTRPEAIKLAPVVRQLTEVDGLRPIVLGTGQHPEMTREMTRLFDVSHDSDLHVHARGQTLPQLLARVVAGVGSAIDDIRPSAVMVQGDTTTTLGAALAAVTSEVPLVHLEAGLRSGDLSNPFPEELNRRAIAPIASLHLAATPANKESLLHEGVSADRVATIGNTVIDAFNWVRSLDRSWDDTSLAGFCGAPDADQRLILLVTMHRRESWGAATEAVAHAVRSVAGARPDLRVVWPVHPNPTVRDRVHAALDGVPNVLLTGPLGYPDFTRLLASSRVALTDSGGVQEEAPAAGVPVLVTRTVTERHEVVAAGGARLVGTDRSVIESALIELVDDDAARDAMSLEGSPYGDGLASARACAAVAELLGVGSRLPDFAPGQWPRLVGARASSVFVG